MLISPSNSTFGYQRAIFRKCYQLYFTAFFQKRTNYWFYHVALVNKTGLYSSVNQELPEECVCQCTVHELFQQVLHFCPVVSFAACDVVCVFSELHLHSYLSLDISTLQETIRKLNGCLLSGIFLL